MFSTATVQKDGFDIIVLEDRNSKTTAEIIPSCGGILHGFIVWNKELPSNIIDHYDSKKDFEDNVSSKGFKSCKLSPFACRIKNAMYQFGGTTYQIKKFLLGDHAIHGLIYDAAFSVLQQHANEENATVVLPYTYRGEDEGYPFHFDCIITYQLLKNNELLISTEIINKHPDPIPVQDGWHPYFTLGKKIDELELEFQSLEQVIFDDQLIPTGQFEPYNEFVSARQIGELLLDNCFKLNLNAAQPLCILKDPENKILLEIRPGKNYSYLQLYTPPDRQSIAIENLSAPPNAFNNGIDLIILPPGESAFFATSYKIAIF